MNEKLERSITTGKEIVKVCDGKAGLYMLSGSPASGKTTALLAAIYEHVSLSSKATKAEAKDREEVETIADPHAAFFSVEMPLDITVMRLADIVSGEEWQRQLVECNFTLGESKQKELADLVEAIKSLPIELNDDSTSGRIYVEDIDEYLTKMEEDDARPTFVGIDFLQGLRTQGFEGTVANREQELKEIVEGLKRIAEKHQVPVVVTKQLNRLDDNEFGKLFFTAV